MPRTTFKYPQIEDIRPEDLEYTGDAPTNEQILSYDSGASLFLWKDDHTATIENNILLNAFRIAINGSLVKYNMVDGIMDEFEDESGVDTGTSTNEDYDSSNDLYSPIQTGTDVKLLLHLNGADGATTTTDSSSSNHTITFNGTAQLDTGEKKWGTASLLLDGDSDYLSIPDSSDWDICGSNSDNWTIDFWVKHTDHAGQETYLCQYEDGNNFFHFSHVDGNGLWFGLKSGGTWAIEGWFGSEITDTDWHHVALCKIADEYAIYLDGTQTFYIQENTTATFTGSFYIGARGDNSEHIDGHIDELRIQHSNAFSASPNVGLTDTITVPTAEHSDPGVGNINLISNSTEAEAEPDDVRMVIMEEDVDACTLNTDILAYASRDNGSNWVQATLSDEGDYGSGKRILVGTADISGQASDQTIKWKIVTANNKDCKFHGVGLLWA